MFTLAKNIHPTTLCDWLGLFCFLGCVLASIGLSCFGIASILKKGLYHEATEALLSMLKLTVLNCGLLLISWAILYSCHQDVLVNIIVAQHFFIYNFAVLVDMIVFGHFTEQQISGLFLPWLPFAFRPVFSAATWEEKGTIPFTGRAVSKGVTLPLLISYGLAALFIFISALGTFGLLANPAGAFDKTAASIVVCVAVLCLAIAARLLRVLHTTKMVSSRMLLESLQPNKVTAFVISHHLGNAFFYYALLCIPLMATVVICIWIEGWRGIISLTNPFPVLSILFFPIFDTICGTRMLIRKNSIWDEWLNSLVLYVASSACTAPIFLLHYTSLISSFGALFFAYIFGLKLFGDVQVLNPYSIMTCTILCFANNLLCANMAAEAPAQIGIYLSAPHAANLTEIPKSEFVAATAELRIL